jgi:hypothetical protein
MSRCRRWNWFLNETKGIRKGLLQRHGLIVPCCTFSCTACACVLEKDPNHPREEVNTFLDLEASSLLASGPFGNNKDGDCSASISLGRASFGDSVVMAVGCCDCNGFDDSVTRFCSVGATSCVGCCLGIRRDCLEGVRRNDSNDLEIHNISSSRKDPYT